MPHDRLIAVFLACIAGAVAPAVAAASDGVPAVQQCGGRCEGAVDRRAALAISWVPTVLAMGAGAAFFITGVADPPRYEGMERAGIAIGAVGIAVPPGFGHFYAGNSGHAVRAMALRTGILALALGILFYCWDTGKEIGVIVASVGIAPPLVLALVEAGTAGRAADRANCRACAEGLSLAIAPRVFRQGERSAAVGASVIATF
jgi:hypothetical protein